MGIVTGATQGIEATTAAMDEASLVDQTTQTNGIDEVDVTDTLANVNNGQITAPTGFFGRKCILRQGAGDEETRKITGEVAGSGTTRILTVGEPWVVQPATGDSFHVGYSSDDMAALTGMTLNALSGVYEGGVSREWQIGQGTNFAYVYVTDYTAWRLPDRGSTDPSLTVRNNGRLDFGYDQGGEGIQGALITGVNNAAAELCVEVEAGGILRCYATVMKSALVTLGFILRATADVITKKMTLKSFTDDCLLLVGTHEDLAISGSDTSAELVRLAAETSITRATFVDFFGLTTEASDTTTETITVRDATFINVFPKIVIEANKTWRIQNPVWTIDESDQSDLNFSNATANGVDEEYTLAPIVQDSSGTKISGAGVFIYEGLRLDDLVQELYTDSDGLAPGSWVYKNFVEATASTLTVLTDGNHALRVDNYGDFPFVAAQTSNVKFEGAIVLNPDPNVVEQNQTQALLDGLTVTFSSGIINMPEIFAFTAGSGTWLTGLTLTFSPSGATGVTTHIVDGDSSAGTLHLTGRNGTAIANGDTFSKTAGPGGAFSGTYTNDSKQTFSKYIDAQGKTLQVVHDFFAAHTARDPLQTLGELIHEWGRENEARVLHNGIDGFFTNRSAGAGVIVLDYGVGTVDKFEDDAGGSYVPPVSRTLTVNVQDEAQDPIENAQASIHTTAGVELLNADTNASGVATAPYVGFVPTDIFWRVRKSETADNPRYFAKSATGQITTDGFTITVTLVVNPFL